MGKRSDFERVPRDYYPTPYQAVLPLVEHLPELYTFTEPCAGDGRLIDHLEKHGGTCTQAYDVEPRNDRVIERDAMYLTFFQNQSIILPTHLGSENYYIRS